MTTLCLSRKQYRNVDSTNMSCCCQIFFKNWPQSNGEFKRNALKFSQNNEFLFSYDFRQFSNHI
jgi:hypothetical protein